MSAEPISIDNAASQRPWALASWVLVKSTGFSYDVLERLRIDDIRASVAEGDEQAVNAAITECVKHLVEAYRDPRLLEAVLLSSSTAYQQLHRWLAADPDVARLRSDDRRRVLTAAMYLQRLCAKNESTSFFGPVYWARVGGLDGIVLDLGDSQPPLLHTGWTYWAAEAIAEAISADPGVRPWIAPSLPPNLVHRDGQYALVGYGEWPIEIVELGEPQRSDLEVRLFRRCDGHTTAIALADAEGLDLTTVIEVLDDLERRRLLRFGLVVPAGLIDPFLPLVEFARALPPVVGRRWCEVLEDLEQWRNRFSSGGSLSERQMALCGTERSFTAVTGRHSQRAAGQHYADRTVLIEDGLFPWRRFDIGEPVSGYLRHEAPVVLDLLFELSLARRRRSVELITDWFARTFGPHHCVPLDVVLAEATATNLAAALRAEEARTTIDGPSALSDELVARCGESRVTVDLEWGQRRAERVDFDTWCVAGADLFVSAADLNEINAGTFDVVVGEVHGLHDQLLQGLWPAMHPRRTEFEAEIGELISGLTDGQICDPVLGHWRKTVARSEVLPEVEFLGHSPRPSGSVGRAAGLTVRLDAGRLVLESTELGRIYLTRPPLFSWTAEIESIFTPFTGARLIGAEDMFRPLDGLDHLPRFTIGRTVVHRETWRIPPPRRRGWRSLSVGNQLEMWRLKDKYGLPDQIYAKFPGEPKPIFVDFMAPVLVDIFSRHYSRATEPVTVSEMLPDPQRLWLHQEQGRHTCELRFGYYRPQPGIGG
ncbi:lantibiotic dehydratase [Nocardia sp. NPDC051570]|uniref:lantibiotic dehydratase n=1 Tax=Nocardia sp. NPDC051570 TaxID=3364324 RepID=UPI0037B3B10C